MTNEEFEAHCAELEKQAEVGKWKNAFESLVGCYLAMTYKKDWKYYDEDIDYELSQEQFVNLCMLYSGGGLSPFNARIIYNQLMEEAGL